MATLELSPELACMERFRASLPHDAGAAAVCDIGERLCAIGRYQSLARGKALAADREEDRLVFIARGEAKLAALAHSAGSGGSAPAPDHLQILSFHYEGDTVPVLRQSDAQVRLIALSHLETVVFSADQFLDVAQADRAVLHSVFTNSLRALERSRSKMLRLGHKSARQRIADFLFSTARRISGKVAGTCEFDLPMSRRDIADSLGLTIETVSRQFGELRDTGLIITRGRSGICLTDLEALAREAGQTQIHTGSFQY